MVVSFTPSTSLIDEGERESLGNKINESSFCYSFEGFTETATTRPHAPLAYFPLSLSPPLHRLFADHSRTKEDEDCTESVLALACCFRRCRVHPQSPTTLMRPRPRFQPVSKHRPNTQKKSTAACLRRGRGRARQATPVRHRTGVSACPLWSGGRTYLRLSRSCARASEQPAASPADHRIATLTEFN